IRGANGGPPGVERRADAPPEPGARSVTAGPGALEPPAIGVPPDAGRLKPAEWRDVRERGSVRLLRLMAFLSLRLGRPLTRPVLYAIALYFFLFSPRARRHSRRYLALALGRKQTVIDRFRHILYFATCIQDRKSTR